MQAAEPEGASAILVVEDEPITRAMLMEFLKRHGFSPMEAGDCETARAIIAANHVDLALIDIHLPDGSGLDLARDARASSDMGIIFLTVMSKTEDRVIGLELGADDYIVKPPDMREMLARIRSTLRRVQAPVGGSGSGVIRFGAWEVDLNRREAVGPDGNLAPLTRAEFDVVAALVHAAGQPVSRDYLLDVISLRSADITERTVDTLISRIRKKLAVDDSDKDLIKTVRGFGYQAKLRALGTK